MLGGVISPVNDAYPKKELAPSLHRVKMVELAAQNYDLVKCSKWEAEQGEWTRTRAVLDHYSSQVLDEIDWQFLEFSLTFNIVRFPMQ